MPNGLITLIVVVLILAFVGIFVTARYGPPKDARRRQVKAAREKARRTQITLNQVKTVLLAESESSLDLVGLDLRRRSLAIIIDYENKELEIEAT